MQEKEKQYGDGDTSYQAAGGEVGLRKLAQDFYAQMQALPEAKVILDMHPRDLEVSIDKLALFLCGWLGGPKKFKEKYGPIHIPKRHRHLPVGFDEKAAWLLCMEKALQEQDYSEDFKEYLMIQLEVPAERIRVVASEV